MHTTVNQYVIRADMQERLRTADQFRRAAELRGQGPAPIRTGERTPQQRLRALVLAALRTGSIRSA